MFAQPAPRRPLDAGSLALCLLLLAAPVAAQPPAEAERPAAPAAAAPPAAGTAPADPAPPAGAPESQPRVEQEASSSFLKGRFLVGATFGSVATVDQDLGTQYRVSPFFRWNSRRSGWGPSFGLSWFTADLRAPVDGRAVRIGDVKIRPVMAGIGYTVMRGRLRTTYGVVTGYAFNDARIDTPLRPGVAASVSIGNAWALQPKVDLTYAVTKRVALLGTAGYVFSNPNVSVTVTEDGLPAYHSSDHVRSDSFVLRVGAAVAIF
jgi:hypothetical protein